MTGEWGYVEKIDIIRERTGLDFVQARQLLEDENWDLLEALTRFEQKSLEERAERDSKGEMVINRLKNLIIEGNNTKFLVKSQDNTVAELPVTVGVLGAVLAPKLALLGAATCLLTRCSIQLNRTDKSNDDGGELGSD
ncbi:MAG TPA: DUF4342 domain-containing protein [Corynebacteriales bacterium]|nr:DUF4342 domain-containing protein [Bacillota bacterium]HHY08800.1 DUF4342 domain-containing protein [Mycobacteriales bacterium]